MVHYRNWHVHEFRSKLHCAKHRMMTLRIRREYEANSYIVTTALDSCCAAVFDVLTCISMLSPKAGPDDQCIATRLGRKKQSQQ